MLNSRGRTALEGRTVGFQKIDHGLLPFDKSKIEGTLLIIGANVDGGSGFQQHASKRNVPILGSGMQRSPTAMLARVYVGAVVDQETARLGGPARGGGVQS